MKKVALLVVTLMLIFTLPTMAVTKLTIWEKYDEATQDPYFQSLVDEFNKTHEDIEVEMLHYNTEDLRENFQNAMMAGEGPDATISPFDHVGVFAVLGIAEPITDILPQDIKDALVDNALPAMSLDGEMYGVPIDMGNHLMLLYNKKFVKEPPKTWDELIKIAKKHTKDLDGDGVNDQFGLVYNLTEPFWFIPFMSGHGGWVMDENRQPTLNTDGVVNAFKFIRDLKFEHKIVPEECDYDIADSLFKENKAVFLINGDWSLNGYKAVEGLDFGTAAIPKFKDYEWPKPMMSGNGFIMAEGLSEEKQEALFEFIRFVLEKENQVRMVKELSILPSTKAAREVEFEDPILRGSIEQLNHTKPMPIVPEMRAIWDALRAPIQNVMNGSATPEDAAKEAQDLAEEGVGAMH
ncbi:extracellular solute-binding protein [Halothermothrix orenii]|uniref:Maltodextrin-binding protein n=1 Tax=Halothermothrix orenii (strain H 168 / OCM 544 / DSM 9562) TaxID=373903 RepID=B8CZU0_HALOH|nr:extracellular solute-binding protein [Halothermothrix orenii]ACL70792.1 extracellular solute-binding protein family 1 [Halothermothrix orenii H 168]